MAELKGYFGAGVGSHILPALQEAKSSIEILAYLFLSPRRISGSGELSSILRCLGEKVKEGVYVSLIVNTKFPNGWIKNRVREEVRRLEGLGVLIKWYPSGSIQHSKMIIVDRARLLCGSVNITSQSILQNNECLLDITAPAVVASAAKHYAEVWQMCKKQTEGEIEK